MVEPFAGDEASARTISDETMNKNEVRLEADQHVREDHVVIGPLQVGTLEPREMGCAALAGGRHSAAGAADLHGPTKERPLLEIVRGRSKVAELIQGGVHGRAVVTLGIVLDDQLPVGGDVVFLLVGGPQFTDPPRAESLLQGSEVGLEVDRIIREVDEDRAHQGFAVGSLQRVVIFSEALCFLHVGCAGQVAIQRIGPGMVGTGDVFSEISLVARAKSGSPMPAEVIESANFSSLLPDQDDSLFALGVDKELASFLDGGFSANVDPLPGEDPFALALVDLLVGKILTGEGGRLVVRGCCHDGSRLLNSCSLQDLLVTA